MGSIDPRIFDFLASLFQVIDPTHGYGPRGDTANPRHFSIYWASDPKGALDHFNQLSKEVHTVLWPRFLEKKKLTLADLAPFKKKE